MMRALFYSATLVGGLFLEIFLNRYFSLFGVGPNLLLIFVVAFGFIMGPMTGETLGFVWGLMADSLGVNLFGLHSLVLTLAGYIAGKLRRRFDAERPTPQIVIACMATLFSALVSSLAYTLTEEIEGRIGVGPLVVQIVLNGLLASAGFWSVDRWIALWGINRDHQ